MCGGDTKCGPRAAKENCCDIVYDEDPTASSEHAKPKKYGNPIAGTTKGIECVCFYVPSPGLTPSRYRDAQISTGRAATRGFYDDDCPPPGSRGRPPQEPLVHFQDICDVPPHENLAIPYPRPAPSVELRGGQIYSGCQCVKRDGLQHDCPRTGCQGKAPCMAYPAPLCVPSGNAPPAPPMEASGQREQRPRGGRHQEGRAQPRDAMAGGYHPADDDDRYVRMGRRGYRENPPVKRRPRVPCEEHRKPRC